jgi:hypothetical protein
VGKKPAAKRDGGMFERAVMSALTGKQAFCDDFAGSGFVRGIFCKYVSFGIILMKGKPNKSLRMHCLIQYIHPEFRIHVERSGFRESFLVPEATSDLRRRNAC